MVGFEAGGCREAGAGFDLAVEAAVVEPVDVLEGGELDVVESLPGAAAVDEFPLVEPVEALGERVVVAVTDGTDRRDDRVVGEALALADGEVLIPCRRDGSPQRGSRCG